MSNEVIEVEVVETGASPFAVRIAVGPYALIGDEPAAKGGGGLGPSPFELLTSALGECTALTVRYYARQQDWPLERVSVHVTHEKKAVEGRPGLTDVFAKTVTIQGPKLTAEQRDRLIVVAGKCPVHRTLENGSVLSTHAGE